MVLFPTWIFDSSESRGYTGIVLLNVDIILKYLRYSRYVESSFLYASLTPEDHEFLHVFYYDVDMVLKYLRFSRYVETSFLYASLTPEDHGDIQV